MKKGLQKLLQKGVLPKTQTRLYSQAGKLLETGLACAFSRTETTVRTTTAATTATIAETTAQFEQQQQQLHQL